jgi:hypothetical protein
VPSHASQHEEHAMTQRGQDSSEAPDIGTGADAEPKDQQREGAGGPAYTWTTPGTTPGATPQHDQPAEGGVDEAGPGDAAEGGDPSRI